MLGLFLTGDNVKICLFMFGSVLLWVTGRHCALLLLSCFARRTLLSIFLTFSICFSTRVFSCPCFTKKMHLLKRGWNSAFFVASNVWSPIFPENFIEISQVVQRIWRISLSILAIFIFFFLNFLTFPCYKETSDVSSFHMSAFFSFKILWIDCLIIA